MRATGLAWMRLMDEGLAGDRADAERWIMAGAVFADAVLVRTAGQRIPRKAQITVRGMHDRYVGKGGHKLEGALKAFQVDVTDRVAMDAGASTGGFVDCLLQHGAARVYAVEVGFGQLHGTLRQNEKVVNMERVNLGDKSLLTLSPRPTMATADLSYLSLVQAVPLYEKILAPGSQIVCLVKPLFETEDQEARRTGILAEDAYQPLLLSLYERFTRMGYRVSGITHSPVTGNKGTREFFLCLEMPPFERPALAGESVQGIIQEAVGQAIALPMWG